MPFRSFTVAEILKPKSKEDIEGPSVIAKNPLYSKESHSTGLSSSNHQYFAVSTSMLFWNPDHGKFVPGRKVSASPVTSTDKSQVLKSLSADRKTEPADTGNTKRRRSRTVFSDAQLLYLEERFNINKYLTTPDRTKVARSLGLTQLQIKTWYQNRRMRWKKAILRSEGLTAEGLSNCLHKNKGRPRKTEIVRVSRITPSAAGDR